ncbi:MAG: PadR family transcriptional regulator [Patescibacteria group bacterium]
MSTEPNISQLRKGLLDVFVLLAIFEADKYPSEIISKLEEKGISVAEGTLYPLLNRLKNDNRIIYRWEESKSGPPRKYFQITDEGKQYLQSSLDSLSELINAIQQLCDENSISFI